MSTSLVAARTVLGGAELVHLGHALLELVVLALLVGVSLILVAGYQLASVWRESVVDQNCVERN